MELLLKNVTYHRDEKEAVKLTEAQALLIVGDLVRAALAQSGFTADVEAQE